MTHVMLVYKRSNNNSIGAHWYEVQRVDEFPRVTTRKPAQGIPSNLWMKSQQDNHGMSYMQGKHEQPHRLAHTAMVGCSAKSGCVAKGLEWSCEEHSRVKKGAIKESIVLRENGQCPYQETSLARV